MKNFVLFISFVLASSLFQDAESRKMNFEEIRENLQPLRKICIERVGVDPKLVDAANKGNFATDKKLQCYYKCLMVMTKLMTKDNKLVEEMFLDIAQYMLDDKSKEPFLDAVLSCQSVTSQPYEGCQLAYEAAKCFYAYDPKLVFFP